MKRVIATVLITALSAQVVFAEAQKLSLYTDTSMSSCQLNDQGTAVRSIYVFEMGTVNSMGVKFAAPKPACWTGATWVGDITPFVTIGNSQTDWSVAYGICKTPPVYVAQINFFATGASQPCCQMSVMSLYELIYGDCNFAEIPLSVGQKIIINPNENCQCAQPVAAEASTWGNVKSLYR